MEKFVVNGRKKLTGEISVSGAKNVALKAIVAACLSDEKVVIKNIPLISDFYVMAEIIKELGGSIKIDDHSAIIEIKNIKSNKIPLEKAAYVRTSSMLMVPLLIRTGSALVPNPGGCRIGARPIDRTIKGLVKMGANVIYHSEDGYFHISIKNGKRLKGTEYTFEKNTHTGTETLIIAAALAEGETVLNDAAEEPEIDELIELLNKMGAKIKRTGSRQITIEGVDKLNSTEFTIGPDRNEIITFAIAALITGGDILVKDADKADLKDFLDKLELVGGGFEKGKEGIRFFSKGRINATDIKTSYYPGFMTDWQGPWAVLMTQVKGSSILHETVYENRFGYVGELDKMGARIDLFNPKVENPKDFYNFNIEDDKKDYKHALRIHGPVDLHNAVVDITDLRAGATLVLAALAAKGESVIFGVEHLDRGYEEFEKRLQKLGADIRREKE